MLFGNREPFVNRYGTDQKTYDLQELPEPVPEHFNSPQIFTR